MSNLVLNPHIRSSPFDGENRDAVLCVVPSGSGLSRYVIPAKLFDFVKAFNGAADDQTIFAEYVRTNPCYTEARLKCLVSDFLIPRHILVPPDAIAKATTDATAIQKRPSRVDYLPVRMRLIPGRVTESTSQLLAWLFRPGLIVPLMPLFIVAHFWFYTTYGGQKFATGSLSGGDLISVLLITTVTGLMHELGHTTALCAAGGRSVDIGWGMYLTFGVFYADVSDAWQLNRWKRALVDVGGIYFHCICELVLLCLYAFSHVKALLYSIAFIDGQIAASLNPFFRMDGYWLLSDLLGTANLRKASSDAIRQIFRRNRVGLNGKSTKIPLIKLLFLLFYSVVSVAFFVYIGIFWAKQLSVALGPASLLLIRKLILVGRSGDAWQSLPLLLALLWRVLLIIGIAYMVFRWVRLVVQQVRKIRLRYREAST